MRQSLKIAISLLASLLLFAGFAVLGFSGLFNVLQTSFFNPRIEKVYKDELDKAAAAVNTFHESNLESFKSIAQKSFIAASFTTNLDDPTIKAWTDTSVQLGVAFRLIGADGKRILYSTLDDDLKDRAASRKAFKNYNDDNSSVPASQLTASAGNPLILNDRPRGQFVYALPVSSPAGGQGGILLFYVPQRDLLTRLVRTAELPADNITLVGNNGLVIDFLPPGGEDALTAIWAGRSGAHYFTAPLTLSGTSTSYHAFSVRLADGGYISLLEPSGKFEMTDVMRGLLLGTFFLTVFLLLFLILNLRSDPLETLRQRVKRFQVQLITDLVETGGGVDWGRWRGELESRKEEITWQIQRGLGRVSRKKKPIIDEYMNKSWTEILDLVSRRNEAPPSTGIGAQDIARLESMIQTALQNVKVVAPAQKLPAARPLQVEEIRAEDVSEGPGERGPSGKAATRTEGPQKAAVAQAPAAASEAVEDAEEAEAVEEAESVEEAAEVEEAADAAPAPAVWAAPAASSAAAAESETIEEAETVEEAEAVEEVEEAEAVEEGEAVEEAAEAAPAPAVRAAPAASSAPAAESEMIEEVETVEEAEAVEEIEDVETVEDVEVVEEVSEAAPAPAARAASLAAATAPGLASEAVEEAEPVEEVEAAEEGEELEEVQAVEEPVLEASAAESRNLKAAARGAVTAPRKVDPGAGSGIRSVLAEEPGEDTETAFAGELESVDIGEVAEVVPLEESASAQTYLAPETGRENAEAPAPPRAGTGTARGAAVSDFMEIRIPGGGALNQVGTFDLDAEFVDTSGELLEELEGLQDIEPLPPEPVEEGLEMLPPADEEPDQAEDKEGGMTAMSNDDARDTGPDEPVKPMKEEPPQPVPPVVEFEDVADFEELEVVEEETAEAEPASAPVAQPGTQEEVAALVDAGTVKSWTIEEFRQIVDEAGSAIIMENGVFRIKEEVYKAGEVPREGLGKDKLREIAEEVVRHDAEPALDAVPAGGAEAEDATGYSGIGDLIRDEESLDLSNVLPRESVQAGRQTMSAEMEKSTPLRLKRGGIDWDELLSFYPRSFVHTIQMKSLVEVSRRVSAVSACLFLKKNEGYWPDLTVGFGERTLPLLHFEASDPFFRAFMAPRKVVAINRNPGEIPSLSGKIDPDDIRYTKRMLLIPATFRAQDAYLLLSFAPDTDIQIDSLVTRLVIR